MTNAIETMRYLFNEATVVVPSMINEDAGNVFVSIVNDGADGVSVAVSTVSKLEATTVARKALVGSQESYCARNYTMDPTFLRTLVFDSGNNQLRSGLEFCTNNDL